ncbi:hypothetical protein [Trichothermofontia sp.]
MSASEYPLSSPASISEETPLPQADPYSPAPSSVRVPAEAETGSPVGHTANRRIAALELALDEALVVLQQLRSQLKDQQVLESQLARLEEFSNMQHQAIGELKHQLTQILARGLSSDRLLQQAWTAVTEFDAQGLLPQSSEDTDSQPMTGPGVAAVWAAAESATTIATLQQALATAHQQIHTLETQIARQTVIQATLQQTCQELERERDQQGKRL